MDSERPATTSSLLIEIGVTLIIPSVILMQLSEPEQLGPAPALLLALAFPVGWGLRDLLVRRRFSLLAALGLVSILLTGGIGLLALDARWLALKEAAVPGLIALAVFASTATQRPLVRFLLYNPALIDVGRVHQRLEARGKVQAFDDHLRKATWMLGATFLFSSAMNYALARWIVVSPAGSAAFNEELGRLTLLSYPAIALPSTLMMAFILFYLSRVIRGFTGLKLSELILTAKG
jgi:intracellular septation protein A